MSMDITRALAHYLGQQIGAQFDWRTRNCCHFAAGWVLALMGTDPMRGLPQTTDAQSARRLVRSLGGSLRAAWSQQLGMEPVPAALAEVGDVVLIDNTLLQTMGSADGVGALVGVCCGHVVGVLADDGALLYLPLAAAECAWPVARQGLRA